MIARRRTQAERRDDSEKKLLEAAIRIIAEQGYEKLRLADLGKAAGVSRGLAAHYFGSRSLLLAMVAEAILQRTSAYVNERALPSSNPLERIYDRIQLYASRWASAQDDGRALLAMISAAPWNEELGRLLEKHNKAVVQWFAEELDAAVAAGLLARRIDSKTEARMIFTFVRGLGTLSLAEVEQIKRVSELFIKNLIVIYEA